MYTHMRKKTNDLYRCFKWLIFKKNFIKLHISRLSFFFFSFYICLQFVVSNRNMVVIVVVFFVLSVLLLYETKRFLYSFFFSFLRMCTTFFFLMSKREKKRKQRYHWLINFDLLNKSMPLTSTFLFGGADHHNLLSHKIREEQTMRNWTINIHLHLHLQT